MVERVAGEETAHKLHFLLHSRVPILDPDLLQRVQNSKKFHHDNVKSAVMAGVSSGIMSGLTYGLSDVVAKKSVPRFKEKHTPAVRTEMLKTVVAAGLTPQMLAVIDAYDGVNDLNGIPDLVPEYQFWMLYIKAQNPQVDFGKLQKYESLRHEAKKERLLAQAAQIDSVGNAVSVTGAVKTMRSKKAEKIHTAIAIRLEEELKQLEMELANATALPPATTNNNSLEAVEFAAATVNAQAVVEATANTTSDSDENTEEQHEVEVREAPPVHVPVRVPLHSAPAPHKAAALSKGHHLIDAIRARSQKPSSPSKFTSSQLIRTRIRP